MSDPEPSPLPPDIARLLDEGRDAPPAPPAERRRVAARLAVTTGLVVPSASLASAKLVAASWATRLLVGAALTLGAGAGLHTLRRAPSPPTPTASSPAAHARPATPTARTTPTATPTPAAQPAALTTPTTPAALTTPTVAAAPPRARPAARAAEGDDLALDEELSLLSDARAALARRDLSDARGALDAHAQAYPRGRMAHEREALRVQCAVAGGDRDEAEAARRRFHARYPGSVLGESIDRAVDGMR